ncbi:MAG: hypothetical protein K2N06_11700 [Oscillospiraceae bacterium]|nr:hypothetical protein [Oscillospiraceae bacterium]
MKSSNTINILGLSVILGMSFLGCADKSTESADNPQSTAENSSINLSVSEDFESSEDTENSEPKIPDGEPTNLIGLDGKPIYTGEINTNITDPEIIERLSDDMFYEQPIKPNAMVDSFLFFKPSTGISYNIYDNPEMFGEEDGFRHFIGEKPENQNEWQRVYVGDKICGLTLKIAEMGLVKSEAGNYSPTNRYYCEFDGTITLTGYLYVNSPAEWYGMPGGEMTLYFCEGAIPMIPSSAVENIPPEEQGFTDSIIFNHVDFMGTSEITSLALDETIDETTADMSGISRGDVVKVKATLSNFKYYVRPDITTYTAHLENIEMISDVIENG